MSLTTSSEWDSLVLRADGEITAIVRMFYGDESGTNFISLSDGDQVTIAGEKFVGLLNQVPDVEQLIDIKTHEHSISDLTLEIDNLELDPGRRFPPCG